MDIFDLSFDMVRSEFPDDFTLRQLAFLGIIYNTRGPHYAKHLAELLKVRKPVITRITNRLMTYGFVERLPDPVDGRGCIINITPLGRDFVKSINLLTTLSELKDETRVSVQHI